MKNRIIIVCITVVLANLMFLLYRGDAFDSFIPFVQSFQGKYLRAYDFFFIIAALLFRIVFLYYGITLQAIRSIPQSLKPAKSIDIGILIGVGILTHFFAWPFIQQQVFREPFSVMMNMPSPFRKTIIMSIPIIWLWAVVFFGRNASIGSTPVQQGGQVLPYNPPQGQGIY